MEVTPGMMKQIADFQDMLRRQAGALTQKVNNREFQIRQAKAKLDEASSELGNLNGELRSMRAQLQDINNLTQLLSSKVNSRMSVRQVVEDFAKEHKDFSPQQVIDYMTTQHMKVNPRYIRNVVSECARKNTLVRSTRGVYNRG